MIILNDRQQRIMELLNITGEVKIADLKNKFDVTEMTIRRDLEKLELDGLAKRTFGGAIFYGKDVTYIDRNSFMIEEKLKIARKAVSFIKPNESIFLDSGTTTDHIARHLKPNMDIKIVTNAINIGNDMIGRNITTVIVGGILLEATSSLVGAVTNQMLSEMAFDRVFLGATGINPIHGLSNSNMYEAEIKKTVIEKATEVNIVVDHTKFGAKELFSFAKLSDIDRIITDEKPGEELSNACLEAGVEILVAD